VVTGDPAKEKIMTGEFLTAEWRHLAMLNYEIDADVLGPLVPAGTELDAWSGKIFVSVVGFLFLRTKVLGIGIPFHRDFEEINLRFYVRREAADGIRRGVVFVREIVPRWAIAATARWVYGERYVACPMWSSVEPPADGDGRLAYGWQSGGRDHSLDVVYGGPAALPAPGSEEEFITEHYWGYAAQRDGSAVEYRVEHPQWRVWAASAATLTPGVGHFYGEEWAPFLTGEPSSAFVADGSPVVVRKASGLRGLRRRARVKI
jgi:uncharacterized protein